MCKKHPLSFPEWLYISHSHLAGVFYAWATSSPTSGSQLLCHSNWCVCYLTVGLICTSLITNDIEPLLTRLLSSCISSFVKCLLKYFAYIFIKLIFFLWFLIEAGYKAFVRYEPISISWWCLSKSRNFSFWWSVFIFLFYASCAFFVMKLPQIYRQSLLFSSGNFIIWIL